ncbi:hypothetical protein AWZ03_004923 [Drosophila navojoa]|uniref:Uncharacterized protein n=1 Tax=Drosophila navojoa TaxID=7232 RepID=A0A484BIU3_DRONA|nr:hypothetical protein AWZ03_004923 [Drosophila navojoa]
MGSVPGRVASGFAAWSIDRSDRIGWHRIGWHRIASPSHRMAIVHLTEQNVCSLLNRFGHARSGRMGLRMGMGMDMGMGMEMDMGIGMGYGK